MISGVGFESGAGGGEGDTQDAWQPDAGTGGAFSVVCPSCGELQDAENHFCTGCGYVLLAADSGAAASSETTRAEDAEEERPLPAAPVPVPGRRSRWPLPVLALVALFAVALGVLWQTEVGAHADTKAQLRAASADVAELTQVRDRLREQLDAAQQLSARRAAVLRRTHAVLSSVDPLLSSVDEMKKLTGDIQENRDSFMSSSGGLVSDLVDLASYLLRAGDYADPAYVNSLIDGINSELSDVRYYAGTLSSADTSYSTASTRFEQRADSLAQAVRALDKQLGTIGG